MKEIFIEIVTKIPFKSRKHYHKCVDYMNWSPFTNSSEDTSSEKSISISRQKITNFLFCYFCRFTTYNQLPKTKCIVLCHVLNDLYLRLVFLKDKERENEHYSLQYSKSDLLFSVTYIAFPHVWKFLCVFVKYSSFLSGYSK